jgi:DNA-binding PadR family transcriptional regulator
MAEHRASLPATAWAVLGVLSFPGERSGYEVKTWADRSLRFFYWSPALSQIYRELRRLEELGYATSREAPQDGLRQKRLYRITDAGREAVAEWAAAAPAGPPVLKHGVLLRVWLGHLLGPDRLRAVLTEHAESADQLSRQAATHEQSANRAQLWPYPELALRWSTRYYEAERDLALRLLEDLDEVAARAAGLDDERPA